MGWTSELDETRLTGLGELPLVVQPAAGSSPDLAAVLGREREIIAAHLHHHGAILFRSFAVKSVEDFAGFMQAVSKERLDYTYRSTPRSAVAEKVFTATAYPAALEIPLHQENAYQRQWPLKLALCCLVPAASGGETPLADVAAVTARLPPDLVDRFEARGVRYVRHYRPGVDLSWQTVFQTEDRAEVASFCAAHGLEHEWLDADTLRTRQTCQGVARHPVTGQRLLFNQAHLFHVTSLGAKAAKSMIDVFGLDRLPRNAFYGDGGEIAVEDLELVRAAFAAEAIAFPWQAGDIVLLDNMRVAHGRRPYKGARQVLAAMSDPWPREAA